MRDTLTMMLDAERYEIDQLIRPIANLYRISAHGQPVAFVRQKKLAIKEDIRFFADENEARELFRIKARAMFEVGGRYDVTAPDGERIGVLEKVFARSLLRSTWRLLDGSEAEVAVAQERSLPVALLRRAIDFVPYGDFIPILFHFTIDEGEQHLGDLTRAWGVRDRYTLDLSGDTERRLDRRLAVALSIALDALQSR
jgi:uncharacterized protein YxjI